MLLFLIILLALSIVFQWFTEEVTLRFLGFLRLDFHRDENPAVYWSVMSLECVAVVFLVYCYF